MFVQAPLPEVEIVRDRLFKIFPEGISDRNYLTREMAARTIFVMLYIDAIEGSEIWLAPKHVVRMSNTQSKLQSNSDRASYREQLMKRNYKALGSSWYRDNTRESIRDETIRNGLIPKGAAILDSDVPTTSGKGRYALKKEFAELFVIPYKEFENACQEWRKHHLSLAEIARIRIIEETQSSKDSIEISLPGGGSRVMSAGKSSVITKAVVEEFASTHMQRPAVIWISESRRKVVEQDRALMEEIGLPIDQSAILPDIVLADVGTDRMLLIFVEVVATDGPITELRKSELIEMTKKAGYPNDQVAFMSAFEDRNSRSLKSRLASIAVDSLVWCMSEPYLLIWFGQSQFLPFTLQNNR